MPDGARAAADAGADRAAGVPRAVRVAAAADAAGAAARLLRVRVPRVRVRRRQRRRLRAVPLLRRLPPRLPRVTDVLVAPHLCLLLNNMMNLVPNVYKYKHYNYVYV